MIDHNADAVLFKTKVSEGIQPYRYCARSNGTKFPLFFLYQEGDTPTITQLVLNGKYFAYTVTNESHGGLAGDIYTRVVNVATERNEKVPDPLAASSVDSDSQGCCSSVVLSPTGVLASFEVSGADASGAFAPDETYVAAFQASTDSSELLGKGAPGSLNDLQIFDCVADCSATANSVVGWKSDGSQEYATVSASG